MVCFALFCLFLCVCCFLFVVVVFFGVFFFFFRIRHTQGLEALFISYCFTCMFNSPFLNNFRYWKNKDVVAMRWERMDSFTQSSLSKLSYFHHVCL